MSQTANVLKEDVTKQAQGIVTQELNDGTKKTIITIPLQTTQNKARTVINDYIGNVVEWTVKRYRHKAENVTTATGVWIKEYSYDEALGDIEVYFNKDNLYEDSFGTFFTIKEQIFNHFTRKNVIEARMILQPTSNSYGFLEWGTGGLDGSIQVVMGGAEYIAEEGPLVIDFTSLVRNETGDVSFNLLPQFIDYSSTNCKFNCLDIKVELTYLPDERHKTVVKETAIAGIVNGKVDLVTEEFTMDIPDVAEENSVMGMPIKHVYKASAEDNNVGVNMRLNLNEKFIKNSRSDGASYLHTDENGVEHGFRDYYYYLNADGNKQYVDKTAVTVDSDGSMSTPDEDSKDSYDVFVEYKSDTGLRAVTEISSELKNAKYFDQRTDEIKQAEEQIEGYKNAMDVFITCNATNGETVSSLKNKYENIETILERATGITDIILTESEALSYRDVLYNKEKLTSKQTDANEQLEDLNNKTSLSKEELEKKAELEELLEDIQKQLLIINDQISLYKAKTAIYKEQLTTYYKEYLASKEKLEELKIQTPINFLTDEHYLKGYNEQGWLVAVYDKYENYSVVEYEYNEYYANYRIARLYDNKEKQVTFHYNGQNKLSDIVDVNGNRVTYTYNARGDLTNVKYDTGENLIVSNNDDGSITLSESKNRLASVIAFTDGKISSITNKNTINNIDADIDTVNYTFVNVIDETTLVVTRYTQVDTERTRERYYIGEDENVSEYRLEQGGVVTKAERYEYVPYWLGDDPQNNPRDVVIYAKESTLNKTDIDGFTFIEERKATTTLNQFNNPAQKVEINVPVSTYIDYMEIEQVRTKTVTTTYTYDDNQKLTKAKKQETYTNPAKTVTSYVEYTYNAMGDIERTESYVVGEELINGKDIEETVYDKQGRVIKTIRYNSLDSSSKFYTETEYDDDGKVISELDQTGEHKTQYSYAERTGELKEETLPNGGKLAYGYDEDGTVTAITQSTESGEENSNNTVYQYGLVKEITSGNTNVKYTYDSKRRVSSIELNGEQDYVTFTYAKTTDGTSKTESVTATYKNGDVVLSETVTDGVDKYQKRTVNGVLQQTIKYTNGKPVYKQDHVNGTKYTYSLDSLGVVNRVIERNEIDDTVIVSDEQYARDDMGSLIGRTINGNNNNYATNYTYKTDSTHTLETEENGLVKTTHKRDKLGRNTGKKVVFNTFTIDDQNITYKKAGDHATNMPSVINYSNNWRNEHVKYEYDSMGNISKIYENGKLSTRYFYDKLNRLVREDNKGLDKTVVMVYDNNGNILKKKQYAFTLKATELLEELTSTDVAYKYDGDKLIQYNNQTCTYNALGNPTRYRGKNLTWSKVNQLDKYGTTTFTYDGFGRRLSKGPDVYFTYDSDGRVIAQSNGLKFHYDSTGISAMEYDYYPYVLRKDALGNVTAIVDGQAGDVVARYVYDAWGNHKVIDGYTGQEITDPTHVGNVNPFRYRGYYFDTETNLYYLKSRYYDPQVGRFISIDSIEYIDPNSINGLNLYAYCGNNPVMRIDPNGNDWWHWLVGGLLLVGTLAVTVLTGGVASGALISSIHIIAQGALIGGITSAVIGAVASGLTYDNGVVSFDWNKAAEGFMWGAITGIVSGTLSAGLSGVGQGLKSLGSFGKLGYVAIQGLINAGITSTITAVQGLITNSFSWENVGLSAIFGAAGGVLGSTMFTSNAKSIIGGIGLSITESFISEIMEFVSKIQAVFNPAKYA